MHGITGNLYTGLYEYEGMAFLLHFLRPEDLFGDIGANMGSYTVLAAAHVGANVIAAEPVPSTFSYLIDNLRVNDIQKKVTALNIAVGSQEGSINFTKNSGAGNHVSTINDKDSIIVNMSSIDKIFSTCAPVLLKIDVEGFETEVLNGASKTLSDDHLKAIIIELDGYGVRYNYDESLIHEKLVKLGFNRYTYNPKKRELLRMIHFKYNNDGIYLRDVDFILKRIRTADSINILGNAI
jgi:FkbM family methyltransferase